MPKEQVVNQKLCVESKELDKDGIKKPKPSSPTLIILPLPSKIQTTMC